MKSVFGGNIAGRCKQCSRCGDVREQQQQKNTHVYYQIATFFEFLFFSTYRNSSYTKSQNVGVAQIDSPSSGDQKSREMKKCARLI